MLAKEAFHSQSHIRLHGWYWCHTRASMHPQVTGTAAAWSQKSGQLPLRPWPWSGFQVAFRNAKSRSTLQPLPTKQQVSSLWCSRATGQGEIFLKSCLPHAVIAMNTPTAAWDIKRRKTFNPQPLHGKASWNQGENWILAAMPGLLGSQNQTSLRERGKKNP